MKPHLTWARASACQLERVLVGTDGDSQGFLECVDFLRRTFDWAPRLPLAGASSVSSFNEKLLADLLFPDDTIALHATDMYSKSPPLVPARPENPFEAWGASCG